MGDIQFNCPKCGHSLIVDAAGAGMSVPCPECNEFLIIPGPEEQHAAQADNANSGVDAASAVSTAPGELSSDTPMVGDQVPKRRSAVRGVARVFWVLFKWVAMAACMIGWLINAAVRWIVVLPMLKARLSCQYRKMGAQSYRNIIDEEKGSRIREQLLEIDHGAEVSGSLPAEGHKSKSRISLLMSHVLRHRKRERLFVALGKELLKSETANDELASLVRHTKKTLEAIKRTKAKRPVRRGIRNIALGMAVLLVIVWAAHPFQQSNMLVADGRKQATNQPKLHQGEWEDVEVLASQEKLASIQEGKGGAGRTAVDIIRAIGVDRLMEIVMNSSGDIPPPPPIKTEHNVNDVVEYINSKLVPEPSRFGQTKPRLKYIKSIGQWVLMAKEGDPEAISFAVIFRFDLLNPNKINIETITRTWFGEKQQEHYLDLYSRNNQETIMGLNQQGGSPDKAFRLFVFDMSDGQKLAEAFQELIIAYGGTGELY